MKILRDNCIHSISGSQKRVLTLVRLGLWGNAKADIHAKEILSHLPDDEWERIFKISIEQAVAAVAFDGILALKDCSDGQTVAQKDPLPPRPLYLKWAARTSMIEDANKRLDETIGKLNALYTCNGLHPVLLKGQGLAANYMTPLHRQCGDIDVFFGMKEWAAACKMLTDKGIKQHGPCSATHAGFFLDKCVYTENHRRILRMYNPLTNRRLNNYVKEWHPEKVEMPEGTVHENIALPLPPVTFNSVYTFLHLFHHYVTGGVGLRQICDWCRLLYVRHNDIDREEFMQMMMKMRILKAAKAFGYIAVEYLGLAAEYLPFSIDTEKSEEKTNGDRIISEIFVKGNFGQYDPVSGKRPDKYWAGKWFTFKRILKESRNVRFISAGEAFWSPIILTTDFIKNQLNKTDSIL